MSKYIDIFADATVDTGSMTDTMTAPQTAVGTKKKVKIDASLLMNLDFTTSLLLRPQELDIQNSNNSIMQTCQNTCETCKTQGGCTGCI